MTITRYMHSCPKHGLWGHEDCTELKMVHNSCPTCADYIDIRQEWEYEDTFAQIVADIRREHGK